MVLVSWGPFHEKFWKKSLNAEKKLKRTLWGFSNIHSVAKQQKTEGGTPWGKIFFAEKKSHNAEKLKGGPFGLARYGLLRGKTENLFGSVR